MIGLVVIFASLLLASAFFSCSEAAMLSLSKLQVQRLVKQKRAGSHIVAKLKERPHQLLETMLIGNNLVNVAAASLAAVIATDYFGDAGLGIATGATTFLLIVFGEVLPKSLAVSHPAKVAVAVAPLIYVFRFLFAPLVWLLDIFASLFRRLFGEPEHDRMTEDEVRAVIIASERDGHLKSRERVMIQNVLNLDDRSVSEAMTPRLDVFALEMHRKVDEVIDSILSEGYSRVPVFDTRMDQMRGVVLVKDLMKILKEGSKGVTLAQVMKPVLFVPENKKLDSLLREFQKRKAAIAIVVDEHGLFIGITTIEDVLEELVGEIYDEDDLAEVEEVLRLDGETLRASGKMLISTLNEEYGLSLPASEDYDTVAGLIMSKLGRIPRQGEEIAIGDTKMRVEAVSQHRVVAVRIIKARHVEAKKAKK